VAAFMLARDIEESETEEEQQITDHYTLYLCIYKPSSSHPPPPI
jgi:hypothetical protein